MSSWVALVFSLLGAKILLTIIKNHVLNLRRIQVRVISILSILCSLALAVTLVVLAAVVNDFAEKAILSIAVLFSVLDGIFETSSLVKYTGNKI